VDRALVAGGRRFALERQRQRPRDRAHPFGRDRAREHLRVARELRGELAERRRAVGDRRRGGGRAPRTRTGASARSAHVNDMPGVIGPPRRTRRSKRARSVSAHGDAQLADSMTSTSMATCARDHTLTRVSTRAKSMPRRAAPSIELRGPSAPLPAGMRPPSIASCQRTPAPSPMRTSRGRRARRRHRRPSRPPGRRTDSRDRGSHRSRSGDRAGATPRSSPRARARRPAALPPRASVPAATWVSSDTSAIAVAGTSSAASARPSHAGRPRKARTATRPRPLAQLRSPCRRAGGEPRHGCQGAVLSRNVTASASRASHAFIHGVER